MPRQIEFAGPPDQCRDLLAMMKDHSGVARISLQPGASVDPEGDIVTVEAANGAAVRIVNLLAEKDLLHSGAITISEPNASIRGNTPG